MNVTQHFLKKQLLLQTENKNPISTKDLLLFSYDFKIKPKVIYVYNHFRIFSSNFFWILSAVTEDSFFTSTDFCVNCCPPCVTTLWALWMVLCSYQSNRLQLFTQTADTGKPKASIHVMSYTHRALSRWFKNESFNNLIFLFLNFF